MVGNEAKTESVTKYQHFLWQHTQATDIVSSNTKKQNNNKPNPNEHNFKNNSYYSNDKHLAWYLSFRSQSYLSVIGIRFHVKATWVVNCVLS